MRPKFYILLMRCIEDGIDIGYQRAFKHTDTPVVTSEDQIKKAVMDAIALEINEWFDFDDAETIQSD